MIDFRMRWIAASILAVILVSAVYMEVALNSDFGRLEVESVRINDGDKTLSGLLYRPILSSSQNPFPAIVIAHGISESKEIMSNLGLELARRGFVTLCLDLLGHGASDGAIADAKDDPSFGVQAAVNYLKSQPYINASAIGLVGHSLGGGAVRAVAFEDSQISALVLIAGGIGSSAQGPQYGTLNATYPRNLLVIIGQYDVLFNLTDLTAKELPSVFNTQQQVLPGVVYGSFQSQTARELLTPPTTHLFESISTPVILEVASWMQNALGTTPQTNPATNLIYSWREVANLIILITLLCLIFLALLPITKLNPPRTREKILITENNMFKGWRLYAIWGGLNVVLFIPMALVGSAISFPPLVFGAAVAWWLLAVGLIGLFIRSRNLSRPSQKESSLRTRLVSVFNRKDVIIALTFFGLFLAAVSLLEEVFTVDLRIISPIFRGFASVRRVLVFPAFILFFLPYFIAEGHYLHEPYDHTEKQGRLEDVKDCLKEVLGKIMPFVAILAFQYLPKLLFNIWILPSFFGFLIEFIWLIIPIFVITTTCSWWFYRHTDGVAAGVIFNALILAWIAAVVFPF
jgi:dienelactone hydrolase